MLRIENIDVFYGKSHVLHDVSLQVESGEIVALLGRNGAGKTTTLRSVMGLTPPKNGQIFVDGVDVTRWEASDRARQGLGYVPQGRHLFPKMSVMDNLKSGMRGRHDLEALDYIFELFPRVKERLSQRASTLSGGEQQMVAIARAMLTGARVLLLDEPTTGLMPAMVSRLTEVLKELNERGMTILLVEEKIQMPLDLAQRMYVLDTGRIVHEGPTDEILQEGVLNRYLGITA